MPIKSVKMKILKNNKMRFFLMSQGSFNPEIRFLGQNVCPVARSQTDTQTHRHTDRGYPFRCFSFNLPSRIGPINREIAFTALRDCYDSKLGMLALYYIRYWTPSNRGT